ncbi:MAG TPA: ABC transporter ATP-binding protein [Deltaproteobacteria bacterium]|nr:ABC transporter ATP-binding protein [Deltaproteobacteria bacterium]
MSGPVLDVRSLQVSYGTTPALKGVSLHVAPGEVVGLVGESGSGKSTLVQGALRLLGRPAVVTGGEVLLDGVDVLGLDGAGLRDVWWERVSLVPQNALNALNPMLTIGAHFDDTLAAHGVTDPQERRRRAEEGMALVELAPETLESHPHMLSGGMRQRVGIALALVLDPKLVIFDEPTTALDVVVERDILDRIQELQRERGFAALFITHDISLLLTFADRVAVMWKGELVETSPAAALGGPNSHPYTKALLAALPPAPGADPVSAGSEGGAAAEPAALRPLLEVRNLSVQFGRGGLFGGTVVRAVRDVSFDLHRGEVLALIGESGSGKSTIGRVVARLQQAHAGTMRLDGESLPITRNTHAKRGLRARVQMVFQDPYASLNPVHTILHHLERPLRIYGHEGPDVRQTAADLLEKVGLSPGEAFLDRKPHALSGGQRQRVAIARALAPKPSLLVADEPTASLDVSVRKEVLLLLRTLQQEQGLGVVLITHDLAAASWVADRLVVLHTGQVMEQGPVASVVHEPQHPYTQLLLAAAAHTPGPLPDWTAEPLAPGVSTP